jgi:predicted cobalt transporter CbtA
MELLRACKGLLWPLAGFAALGLGVALGYTVKSVEDELRIATVEGLCRPSKSWSAHVSTDSAGYICFKQQIYNKRIIKYIIVEGEIDNE